MNYFETVTKLTEIKIIDNYFLKVPGYIITAESFTGVSEVRKTIKTIKLKEESTEDKIIWTVVLFFNGMMTHLSFNSKKDAEECRVRILDVVVHWHKNKTY